MWNNDFSVEHAVKKRYSVRSYEKRLMEKEVEEKLLAYADKLRNPLGPEVNIKLIKKNLASNGEKLGTYGVIKGAHTYLGVTVPDEEGALEALGYDFEQMVLYAASLGLGTCWLGGTFNRGAFAEAMQVREGELFPIVSPVGYPAEKKSILEQVMRRTTKADARLPWKELFFRNDFRTALAEKDAGEYRFPLEMLRMAPSAVNKQPWRVVITDHAVHFFEKHSMKIGTLDMQRIDMGIAICHFHLAVLEQGGEGHFERKNPEISVPDQMSYIVSWIPEVCFS